MKTTLALANFLTLVLGAVPPNAQWYTLSTKSETVNSLSNLYLSPGPDGKIGAYPQTRESASKAFKFFTTAYNPAGTVSLHPGTDTHQVALQAQKGQTGLLQLVDLDSPSGEKIDPQMPTMWSVFTIGPRGNVGVKDGSDVPSRTWAVWLETDGNYYVGLWDGVSKLARTVSNITLVAGNTDGPKV